MLLADNKTLLAVWRNEAEAPPATTPATACDECSYTRTLSTDRGRTWHDHRFLPPGVGAVTPELLLMRHPSGRAGPLLLSGGRANTSHLTGNLTSHNVRPAALSLLACMLELVKNSRRCLQYDNMLWISWDGWGSEWVSCTFIAWIWAAISKDCTADNLTDRNRSA
eukprot:COSAG04_NODE_45_length_31617_cov_47.863284_11_plen_166_part_00